MNVNDKEFDMLDEVINSVYNRGIKDGMEDGEKRYKQGLEDAWNMIIKIENMTWDEFKNVFGFKYESRFYEKVSVSEAMQKLKKYEEQQKQDEKSCGTCKHVMRIDCGAYPCSECPRDTLPKWEPKQTDEINKHEEQDKKSCKDCKHDLLNVDDTLAFCHDCIKGIKDNFEPKQTDASDINDGSIKVGDEVRIKGSDLVKNDCDYGVCTRSLPNINTIYVMRRDGSSGEENKDEWYRTGRYFPQIAEVLKLLRGDKG